MTEHNKKLISAVIGALVAASTVNAARADDLSDRISLHGFGYQVFKQTSDNTYLGADNKGSWDDNKLGLVTAITMTDKSKLWAQLEGASTPDGTDTHFTWFFVDYQFTNNLRGHVGRVKMPLGLYNETIDTRFLQVTELLPSMYQEATDTMYDAYNGLGVDYDHDLGGGHMTWQLYGGNINDARLDLLAAEPTYDRRTIGGALTYLTPIDGLKFVLSYNNTTYEVVADSSLHEEPREIASLSYVNDSFDIKAEYAYHRKDVTRKIGYLQVAYHINDKWTPYLRYDYAILDDAQKSDPSYYQKDATVGVGYKITPYMDVRVENHFNHGYGLPIASGEILTPGTGKTDWNMFVAGVNFMF
ncbi:MAG: hypothetical protein P8141_02455 [Gammaproteobacteria bacterium]